MAKYIYRFRKGKRQLKGIVEADSPGGAVAKAKEVNGEIVSIRKKQFPDFTARTRKATASDIIFFTKHLQLIVKKNMPLAAGLEILLEDMPRDTMQEAVFRLKKAVEEGKSLADGLASQNRLFPKTYIRIIRTGEESAGLQGALEMAAGFLETEENLYNRIKAALLYPGSFTIAAFFVYVFMAFFLWAKILPVFISIFQDYGIKFAPLNYHFLPVLMFLAIFLATSALFIKAGFSKTVFSLPLLSRVRDQMADITFMRFLENLLRLNIPLKTSLARAGEILTGEKRGKVNAAMDMLDAGTPVEDVMEKLGIFTFSELWLIKNGIKSGHMESVMASVIDMRETTLQARIGIISSVIQPFFIVLAGIMTGVMVSHLFGKLVELTGSLLL